MTCVSKKKGGGGGGEGGQLTFGGEGIKIWWGNFSKFLAGGNFWWSEFLPFPQQGKPTKQEGWGYGISRGAEEIANGFFRGLIKKTWSFQW